MKDKDTAKLAERLATILPTKEDIKSLTIKHDVSNIKNNLFDVNSIEISLNTKIDELNNKMDKILIVIANSQIYRTYLKEKLINRLKKRLYLKLNS